MIKNSIPFIDLRGKTPIDLLRAYPDKASEIIKASTNLFGLSSRVASALALPVADKKSLNWLKLTRNPYLYEIESFSEILSMRGIFALNLCYEWGCTSGIYRSEETVSMLRVLDWPLPALGSHMVIALQKGKAGEFYNITWPATSGVYTAMAPGRFAAAINQAPMRMHELPILGNGFWSDWLKNRRQLRKEWGLPPSHLLRQVFEQASTYAEAKQMLMETPIAIPVIFTLSGTEQGEGCVIERLERSAQVLELHASQQLTTANHFNTSLAEEGHGWRSREIDSMGRFQQSCDIHGYDLRADHFGWLRAPMINRNTKVCVIADAATHRLVVQGYDGMTAVTDVFNMPAEIFEYKESA